MTAPNPHATQTHLQPLQRAFHAFRDFTFEHGGLLKNHKQFHELASHLYKEICNLNAVPEPAAQQPNLKQLRQELYDQTKLSEEAINEVSLWMMKRNRQ